MCKAGALLLGRAYGERGHGDVVRIIIGYSMQHFNFMKSVLSFILVLSLVFSSCTQYSDVSATLSANILNDSTMLIRVKLCNNTSNRLYLTCGWPCGLGVHDDFHIFQPYIPSDSSITTIIDTIKISYPNIKQEERYQINCFGDTIDIYYLVSRLFMKYTYEYMARHSVPSPPNDADSLWFCDYNFLKLCREKHKDWTDIAESGTSNYVVLLNPFEKRIFSCNEAFLLPLKTTYKMQLSLSPNDTLHCNFLDSLGYLRYDEIIISDPLIIDNN